MQPTTWISPCFCCSKTVPDGFTFPSQAGSRSVDRKSRTFPAPRESSRVYFPDVRSRQGKRDLARRIIRTCCRAELVPLQQSRRGPSWAWLSPPVGSPPPPQAKLFRLRVESASPRRRSDRGGIVLFRALQPRRAVGLAGLPAVEKKSPKSSSDNRGPSKPHGNNSKEKETPPQTLWNAMKRKRTRPECNSPKRTSNHSYLPQWPSLVCQPETPASIPEPACKATEHHNWQQSHVKGSSDLRKPKACGKPKRTYTHQTDCKLQQKGDGFMPPSKKQKMDSSVPDATFTAVCENMVKLMCQLNALSRQTPGLHSTGRGTSQSALKAVESILADFCDSTLKFFIRDTACVNREQRQMGTGQVRGCQATH